MCPFFNLNTDGTSFISYLQSLIRVLLIPLILILLVPVIGTTILSEDVLKSNGTGSCNSVPYLSYNVTLGQIVSLQKRQSVHSQYKRPIYYSNFQELPSSVGVYSKTTDCVMVRVYYTDLGPRNWVPVDVYGTRTVEYFWSETPSTPRFLNEVNSK